jgi:hypothetical protein
MLGGNFLRAVTVREMLRLFNERGIASLNAQSLEVFYEDIQVDVSGSAVL